MNVNRGILVIAEQRNGELDDISLGLLLEGRQIADKLGTELSVILIANRGLGLVTSLARQGADLVYFVSNSLLANYSTETAEAYTKVISELVWQEKPRIILCASGAIGRDLAPRLAARLKTGLVLDCIGLTLRKNGALVSTKPVLGGKCYASIICRDGNPPIFAIRPDVMEIRSPGICRKARIIKIAPRVTVNKSRIKLVRTFRIKGEAIPLTEADIVVSGGRGVGSIQNWKLIEELAQVLGGVVAGSRPAVDAGFIPGERQVGLSGASVTPRLYIACGISGANHHIMGMRESKTIVAINKDRGAPIFKIADVCVLGDILEVIPALVRNLRAISQPESLASAGHIIKGLSS